MKNVVFISPNFPDTYWKFCHHLKENGMNVLGIGDAPYDELSNELKDSLNEYYKVDSLEDYDQVYRGVAFLIFKYGPIDWLESNNEYWLERDAMLRTAFHITSGFQVEDMPRIKYKSRMKEYYAKAGIPTARYYMVESEQGCRDFIKKVGWPVVAKPDNGVGANHTYKLAGEADLRVFLESRDPNIPYIMEEFIHAEINSYDAIINSAGEPMFETGNVTLVSLMDVVNDNGNCAFYIQKELPADVRKAGRATVKSFGVKSRFVHLEFFRLTQDQEGLGKKGDIVALEVNMRPSGGISPDMMNFAHSTDVYKVWADMIAFDHSTQEPGEHNFCVFAGRRDGKTFKLSHEALVEKYGPHLKLVGRVADALSGAMGNQMYIANFPTKREMERFLKDALGGK